ncbi:MAG: trypsin-like peptidase domain-containing protein [Candidatus Babeliales bacterium]|nr:MAG: Serine protease MucD [candidate division TM6 bacterium GW2011_GWF2_36_6]
MKNKIYLFATTILSMCLINLNAEIGAEQMQTYKQEKLSWAQISEQSRSAVVQIFSYTKEPHHFVRYKTPEDGGGCGTGFIINHEGEILTNFHVVDKAVKIFIQHPDLSKERFEVEYVGGCPEQDIALLRLKNEDCSKIKKLLKVETIPYLEIGNSDELVEAQKIMALGYPQGKETVKSSCGGVSGRESTHIGECIQTTTPVNPGNSGGPFLNKFGQVIGICVLKHVGTEIEGIAYLIPINNAKRLLPQLRKSKIVRRPYWGISYQPINQDLIDYLKISEQDGVLITKIYKNSLCEQAGLKKNDIICAINNEAVDRYGYIHKRISLMDFLNTLELESTVIFDILRDNKHINIEFIIEQGNSFEIKEYHEGYEELPPYEVIGGLVITELNLNQIEIAKAIQANLLKSRYADSSLADISSFTKYEKPQNRFDSKVIISYIIPGSEIENSRCVKEIYQGIGIPADPIIKNINGIKVANLDDARNAILQTQKFMTIETTGGSFISISLEKLVTEDTILSEQEGFETSNLVEALLEKTVVSDQSENNYIPETN